MRTNMMVPILVVYILDTTSQLHSFQCRLFSSQHISKALLEASFVFHVACSDLHVPIFIHLFHVYNFHVHILCTCGALAIRHRVSICLEQVPGVQLASLQAFQIRNSIAQLLTFTGTNFWTLLYKLASFSIVYNSCIFFVLGSSLFFLSSSPAFAPPHVAGSCP